MFSLDDQQKENEWLELVGIDFYSLPKEKRRPIKEFYSEIKQILEAIRKLPQNIKIVQFENDFEAGNA